jgi:hypothetical protein
VCDAYAVPQSFYAGAIKILPHNKRQRVRLAVSMIGVKIVHPSSCEPCLFTFYTTAIYKLIAVFNSLNDSNTAITVRSIAAYIIGVVHPPKPLLLRSYQDSNTYLLNHFSGRYLFL